jgi:hypothetical protein
MEQKVRIVVGFLSSRKLNDDERDEDESEDENDDDDFDFSTAGLKTKLPGKKIVKMLVVNHNVKVEVKCRLPWTWSWLQVTPPPLLPSSSLPRPGHSGTPVPRQPAVQRGAAAD